MGIGKTIWRTLRKHRICISFEKLTKTIFDADPSWKVMNSFEPDSETFESVKKSWSSGHLTVSLPKTSVLEKLN